MNTETFIIKERSSFPDLNLWITHKPPETLKKFIVWSALGKNTGFIHLKAKISQVKNPSRGMLGMWLVLKWSMTQVRKQLTFTAKQRNTISPLQQRSSITANQRHEGR